MAIPAQCRSCGLVFLAQGAVGGTGRVTIMGGGTDCPRCGGEADFQPGTYDLVGSVVRAFTAPGVGHHTIYRFRDVAQQVQAGTITTKEATDQIAQLGPALAQLWKWANQNGAALALLLVVIQIYLQIAQGWSDDAAAEKQLKETQKQTQVMQSAEQVQKKIIEELQKKPEALNVEAAPAPPKGGSKLTGQPQTPSTGAPLSRQQRRRAEQLAKKRAR